MSGERITLEEALSGEIPDNVLVRVLNLRKLFPVRTGFLSMLLRGERLFVHAVDGVSFDILRGETLALVGESGCGKTTTGRLILRLIEPTSGKVFFDKIDIFSLDKKELQKLRTRMQMIFQDPYGSLNPRLTIFDTIAEPLRLHNLYEDQEDLENKVAKALEEVGLTPPESFMIRYPHELSGGQRQRVAIARALIVNPEFIVADEPVSMIDVSLRAGILNLMLDLKEKYKMTYLFITHDLAQARYMSDHIAVMYLGKIVEIGPTEEVIREPLHPYTKALISNVPIPDPEAKREKIILKGEVPSPINPPPGCRFHTRCPYAKDICKKKEPELLRYSPNHYAACHLLSSIE